jgi:RNA polymerase sigma-70 factor (ECF subfamily)
VRGFGLGGADDIALLPDPQPRIDAVLLAREVLDVLARAVDALSPRTREVFCLHKFEGKSYAEIADELHIAKNTVMVHMMKALKICRDALREHRQAGDMNNGSGLPERLPMA